MLNSYVVFLSLGAIFLAFSLARVAICMRRNCGRNVGHQLAALASGVLGVIWILWALELRDQIPKYVLDGAALSLAVAAIAFAAWQFRDSRSQQHEMTVLAGQIRDVASQMATRFAGFFPDNLQEINLVVSKAQNRLDVMSDIVGYGHYSAPHHFDAYFHKLLDLASRDVEVRMLVYARDMAEEMHETQFMSDSWKELPNWERLKQFCKRYKDNFQSPLWEKIKACDQKMVAWTDEKILAKNANVPAPPELDSELKALRPDFDQLMFDRQLTYMKALLERGIEIRKTTEKLPFFLWCEDQTEAVFAFLHETSKAEREVSFSTRDSRFVANSFEKKFDYLWGHKSTTRIELVDVDGHLEPDWLPSKQRVSLSVVTSNEPERAVEWAQGARKLS